MATVGINFGNLATGGGFDVAGTVSSILAIQSSIESPWKTQLTALAAQDTVLSSIGTHLSTLSSSLEALTSFDGVMFSKLGSSSDTNTLTLSAASSSAIAGSHTVVVSTLASTSSQYSDRVPNKTDLLSGSVEIQVGSSDKTIVIDTSSTSTNNTLQTLATTINSGAYGVTASVVQDTLGYRLSLVSQSSGSAGAISLTTTSFQDETSTTTSNGTTSATPLAFHQGQAGIDAVLNVDGLDTTSASNTVTGAIPGVTFQLLAATGSPVQIQITNDNSSIETAFSTLVTSYNAVASDVTIQEGKDANGVAEPLYGSPTLAMIQNQLSSALLSGIASGGISNLAQLGLNLDQTGQLTLGVSTLDAALNSNFSDIVGFMQNTGNFGQTLTTTLDSLGSVSTKGTIYLAKAENTSKEAALNLSVTNQDARIAAQKITLTTELNMANQILQGIPDQLSEISQIYSAVTGYNTGSG